MGLLISSTSYRSEFSSLINVQDLSNSVLSVRFGRTINVEIQDNDVRMPIAPFAHFWSAFIHAVRNSIDHGVEPRGARGSTPEQAKLVLCAEESPTEYMVSISDDGRGID